MLQEHRTIKPLWLTPEGEEEDDGVSQKVITDDKSNSNYSLTNNTAKSTKADKFDKLFDDDKDDSPF